MQDLRDNIDKIGPTDITVVVQGERGTGKEAVANEIHLKSHRATGPYIRVNCASIPESLADTEYFKCERGAFTGAEARQGKFEQADGGTILLDEIAEMSLLSQAKLLRVIQEREVDRIGGKRPIPVNIRLIVSTNRNLREMTRNHLFREDLFDRLSQDIIRVPPLRERLEDIPTLCEYFIGLYVPQARRLVSGVAPQVLDLFQRYSWPGNVRELENIIRRGVFKGRSEEIRMEDLASDFIQEVRTPAVILGNFDELTQGFSRQLLVNALTHCRGNKTKAMKILGLGRTRFYDLLGKLELTEKSGNGGSPNQTAQGSNGENDVNF